MIPKIIHYCWFGNKPLPSQFKKYIDTWKKNCPDYEFRFWNNDNYDLSISKFTQEAFKLKKYAFVSDFVRLDVLYRYGGVYLDIDVELVKNLDNLLDSDGFIGFESATQLNDGLIFGSSKGNSMLLGLMSMYDELDPSMDESKLITPYLRTKYFMENGAVMNGEKQSIFNGSVMIYPIDYFCPLNSVTGELHVTENTYSIHHFAGTWVTMNHRINKKLAWMIGAVFGKKMLIGMKQFKKKIFRS